MPQPDYQTLAASFLDLWQEQMARSLTDRDFIQKMMQAMQSPSAPKRGEREQTHRHTAHASGPQPDELDGLRHRVATCERRIRQIEAQLEAAAKPKTVPKPKAKAKAPKATGPEPKRRAEPARPLGKPAKRVAIKRATIKGKRPKK